MKKIGLMKSKKFVIYGKTDLVLMMIIKKYHKVRDHCHNTGKSRVENLQNTKRNSCIISLCSMYDYHFIVKELAKEF